MKLIMCGLLLVAAYVLFKGPLPMIKLPTLPERNLPQIRFRKEVMDFESQIGFLYAIKAQVLSGATNNQALVTALGAIQLDYLSETRRSLQEGTDLQAAMGSDSKKDGFVALAELSLIFSVSEIAGAPISAALTRLIHNLVATRTSKQLIAAELASTKATILVLASLPVIGILLATILGAAPLSWLFHTMAGRFFLILGLTLEVLGLIWVKRITSRATLGTIKSRKNLDIITSEALVNLLENLSLCLAAGMNISNSVLEISKYVKDEIANELNFVISRHNLGAPMNVCLGELGQTKPRWRPLTDALVGALMSGGPIQSHLEDLLNSYRMTAEMENLKRIRSISVRAVAPLGICFLPAFLLLAIAPMVVGLFNGTVW